MEKVSAVVITYNEEEKIEETLKALSFVDEIVVIDSNSTDSTVEICKRYGATVYLQDFLGYGQQKNFAATKVSHPWILSIDADEVVTEDLKKSVQEVMKLPLDQANGLYQVDRLNFFCGKPIFHGGWYPDYNNRLYKKADAKWTEPFVHEKLQLNSPSEIGKLSGKLNHYSFTTLTSQVLINLKYAKRGSKDLINKLGGKPSLLKLIIKPFGKFIECYILKKGFLDGVAGFIIAINAAYSLFLKYAFAYWGEE